MKKCFVIFLIVLMIAMLFCGCEKRMSTEEQQVWKVAFETEEGYLAYITTPAPADKKTYSYDGYHTTVSFVKTADAHDSFEEEAVEVARLDTFGEFDEWGETLRNEKNFKIEGLPAYKAECEWNIGDDISNLYRSYVTAIKAEDGVYVFNTYYYNDENKTAANKHHKRLVKSIELAEADDPEVFVKNVGQVDNLLFSLDGWDRRLVHNGVVAYLSETELEYYMMIKPVNELDITDKNLCDTVMAIYSGAFEKAEVIEQKAPVKTMIGNAIWTSFKLTMGEESMNASALFVCNDSNKIIACFMIPDDEELKEDYRDIIDTVQYFDEHEEQFHNLWNDKTDYIGENDNVVALVSNVGFKDYTVELKTEEVPYGLIVNVKDDDLQDNLERECILLLGLIGNLDHVTIIADSGTYTMNVDQANSVLKYDVKKLGKSKPLLERYLLETYI